SNRLTKNGCSHGSRPYQMTMYCDQFTYIQKTEKAKTSLPRSWNCFDVMYSVRSMRERRSTTAIAVAATPPWNAAQKKVTGNMVLKKCGSIVIARSIPIIPQRMANRMPMTTPRNFRTVYDREASASTPRQPLVSQL